MTIDSLKDILNYHDNLYYNNDSPEISDEEYDALKDNYIELSGEYNEVPGEVSSNLKRVKHSHPIISLEKVNNIDTLRKELERLAPVVIEPKLDGLTVVSYPDKYVTRGNGFEGEDISHTASKINDIAKANKVDYTVRMEAFMRIPCFNDLNNKRLEEGLEAFKNPRNAAAGMLRNKDADKVSSLSYMAYSIVGSNMCQLDQIEQLRRDGFIVVPTIRFEEDEIDDAINFIVDFDRELLDYEIDGLVIKSDKEDSLNLYGTTGHHPKDKIAWKFKSEGLWTKLNSITWQAGRTGRITPVAEIEPVDLLGSTISRVTLHNIGIMNAINIKNNSEVFLIKANDVIPAITKAKGGTSPVDIISTCPSCDSSLEEVNQQLFCRNPLCKEKLLFSITHIASRDALDIEGLSEETAKKLIDFGLTSPFEIFELSKEDILNLPGFAEKSANNLYSNIQLAKKTELKRFIYAAGLPNVGRTVSEDISNTLGSYKELIKDIDNNLERTKQIHGIGEVILKDIKRYSYLLKDLHEYVSPIDVETKKRNTEALSIVITGSFMDGDRKVSRKELETMIKDSGNKVSSSVSKNTDYVMVGEKPGSKANKARSLDVPIINNINMLKEIIYE